MFEASAPALTRKRPRLAPARVCVSVLGQLIPGGAACRAVTSLCGLIEVVFRTIIVDVRGEAWTHARASSVLKDPNLFEVKVVEKKRLDSFTLVFEMLNPRPALPVGARGGRECGCLR